jgi:hypothetical protein
MKHDAASDVATNDDDSIFPILSKCDKRSVLLWLELLNSRKISVVQV